MFHLQSMKAPDLKEKLEESEKLLKEMRKTWEEKLAETEKIHQVGTVQQLRWVASSRENLSLGFVTR